MRLIINILLSTMILIGCSSNEEKWILNELFSLNLPAHMDEFKEIDSIPDYLKPLFEIEYKECQYFAGDGEYFAAFIVDTPCENNTEQFAEFRDLFRDLFTQVYPFIEYSIPGNFKVDNFDYYYDVFSLEFSFANYTIFYALSSINGNLLYMNYWQQDGSVESIKGRGIKIVESIKRNS